MIKATKPQIMRELKAMRTVRLKEKEEQNRQLINEYKIACISKHYDSIDSLITKLAPIVKEVKEFVNTLANDSDINLSTYYIERDLISTFTSRENVENFILDKGYWYRGSTQRYADVLSKSYKNLEREWDNLIINCSSMSAKDLRQFIEDNKIELPCTKEESKDEPKALAVMNVDLDLLFGGNRNDK